MAPFRKDKGPIVERNFRQRYDEVAKKIGVKWKHNALRHSYASYRLALVQDAAKVALELGHSPTILFKHYRELVMPDQAEAWFRIEPPEGWETRTANQSVKPKRKAVMSRIRKTC